MKVKTVGSVQITNGHTLALLRSETDRVALFAEILEFIRTPSRAVVWLVGGESDEQLVCAAACPGMVGLCPEVAERLEFHRLEELFQNGRFSPGTAVDWLNRQWSVWAAKGMSSVCFAIDMGHASAGIDNGRLLALFESTLEEFCAGPSCVAVTYYQTDEYREMPYSLLRSTRQVWLDDEVIPNPYYTPAAELFGADADVIFIHQMLDTIRAGRDRDTLLDNEDLLRALFREIDVGFALFEVTDEGDTGGLAFHILQTNPVFEELNDSSAARMIGKNAEQFFPTDSVEVIDIFCETAATGMSARFERYKENIHRYFEVIAFRPKLGLCAALVTDITERKRIEENKQKSEFRIRQTQKMEAIGRLAGGVAHDFNNILTAIVALANVLMEELPAQSSQWEDAEEIKKAADRAATLTRQLLAFSRKQEVSPKVVNLNRIIGDSHRMLSRIMGEDIQLRFVPGDHLKPIKIDPGHMEQVLANFVANSRDAMLHGGEMVIETRNVTLREHHITMHGELLPGNYVMLSARDTGVGMSESVQERIFEPFFTTKEKGKGTGLGLATVYGIVRQHGGVLTVSSSPGNGTAFEVYFPWADSVESERQMPVSHMPAPGNATVLLAEDEETVRNLTVRILERNGYKVISAANGEDAIKIWPTLLNRVDFLLTDVIMPGMNGLELYRRLKVDKPDLKVLYISGYPEDVIAEQGEAAVGIELLEKPFSPTRLLSKIHDILNGS